MGQPHDVPPPGPGANPPPPSYSPPPAFAPPAFRGPPLNAWQYGYPGAPQPGWQQSPYPPVAWRPGVPGLPVPAPQPPSRRRVLTIAMVATVVAVLVVIGTLLLTTGRDTGRRLSLPASVDEYTQITVISRSQLDSMFGGGGLGGITPDDLRGAKAAFYGVHDDSEPQLVFVGFDAADSPSVGDQLRSTSPADVTSDALEGAGATGTAASYDAGTFGGSLRACVVDVDGGDGAAGVWADHDTLGIVVLVHPTGGAAQAASVTLHFRTAAER